jgi:catechol-2,3-dioxygenase
MPDLKPMKITRKPCPWVGGIVLAGLLLTGFTLEQAPTMGGGEDLTFQANMVFFYYKDLEKAADFYENVLGLNLILDYGLAKAYRISQTSYICLVDEKEGMHDVSEPKTITLAFLTEELEEWYEYLLGRGVEMRSPLKDLSDSPFRAFVALDPEGYFLEFETYFDHPQNTKLINQLKTTKAFYSSTEDARPRPESLGIQGNIIWLYYEDLDPAGEFYETVLGLELLVDEGFDKIYASSPSSFIGVVGPTSGLHRFTEKKSVNIGFFTKEVDKWYQLLLSRGVEMRAPLADLEEGLVHAFVGYDVGGYYLEFDKFLEDERNKALLEILNY